MTEAPPLPTATSQISSPPVTSKAAVFSLILGILSNLCLWLLGSIPAIILVIVAIRNINRNSSTVGGKGLAIAGIITGGTGLIIGSVVFSIFFIGVSAYQKGANRSRCILQMATVQKLVLTHANLEKLKHGDVVTIDDLIAKGYITETPTCPDGGTYTFLGKVPDSETAYIECDHKDPTHPFLGLGRNQDIVL